MFKSKKGGDKSSGDPKKDLANMLGGLGMDPQDMAFGIDLDGDDSDDDDASLEAELAALQGEGQSKWRKKQDDEDEDDDLDNPELLAELQSIAPGEDVLPKNDPTPIIQPRKVLPPQESSSSSTLGQLEAREKMYQTAIGNAEKSGESSKARRYGRGLKQIEQMIKQCKTGKQVNLDELPPELATGAPASSQPLSAPSIPEPTGTPNVEAIPSSNRAVPQSVTTTKVESKVVKPSSAEKEQTITLLKTRQNQYKVAALTCKRSGDIAHAKQFLVVSKQIGVMLENVSNDQVIDVSSLPPEPALPTAAPKPETESRQQSGSPTSEPQLGPSTEQSSQSNNTGIPPPPKDVNEALQQRLEKYQQAANKAKEEGNGSKARRMGRIVKQYEDAIKAYKTGRHVDFEELPTPPGFEEIPLPGKTARQPSAPEAGVQAAAAEPQAPKLQVQIPKPVAQPPPQHHGSLNRQGRNEQQLNFLVERQKEFKTAALKAKKRGDIEEAKQWLRMSKGLDPMIENASNGLRVDLSTVPPSPLTSQGPAPTASANYVMVETRDCVPNPRTPEEVTELYARLEDALIKQTEMCIKNGKHYQKLGDLNSAKMYERMGKNLHQDLDAVKSAKKHKDPPPKFHYEDKTFTVVNSFPELSDSEVEIEIARCLNVPLPSGYSAKDMYTYVTFEFPYPNPDEPQAGRTKTVKHSINPEYNESFKVNIDRKNRALARIFKRQNVKFEVKYERGFLKGDKTIGQAQIKLAPFDSKCEIHECVDLMDTDRGRKAVGGKIEVRLRTREPLTDKDVQMEKWKWLVIDMHLGGKTAPDLNVESIMAKTSPTPGRAVTQGSIDDLVSVEVLKMEKQLAERQVSAQKAKSQMPSPALIQRYKQCSHKMEQLQIMLSKADKKTLENYVHQLASQVKVEQSNAQRALQAGNKTEAHLCNTRKKLMQNEIISIKPKLGLK